MKKVLTLAVVALLTASGMVQAASSTSAPHKVGKPASVKEADVKPVKSPAPVATPSAKKPAHK